MTGKGDYFPGLVPLIYAYLELIDCDPATLERVSKYLELIRKRALGELKTPATWMRDFVMAHPEYKKDSFISEGIAHDLMMACKDIGEGRRHEPTLTGDVVIEPIDSLSAYDVKLDSKRLTNKQTYDLLQKYMKRSGFAGADEKEGEAAAKATP